MVAEIYDIIPPNIELKVLSFSFHLAPKKLHQAIKEVIKLTDEERRFNKILLGYGLCSNAVLGLKSNTSQIVIPKMHDCINILMGSSHRFIKEQKEHSGTFYLSKGWIKHGEDPLSVLQQKPLWTKKYDKKSMEKITYEVIKNYERIVFIDTNQEKLDYYLSYSQQVADYFNLKMEVIQGSLNILKKLMFGPHDEDFCVLEPGKEIVRELLIR